MRAQGFLKSEVHIRGEEEERDIKIRFRAKYAYAADLNKHSLWFRGKMAFLTDNIVVRCSSGFAAYVYIYVERYTCGSGAAVWLNVFGI